MPKPQALRTVRRGCHLVPDDGQQPGDRVSDRCVVCDEQDSTHDLIKNDAGPYRGLKEGRVRLASRYPEHDVFHRGSLSFGPRSSKNGFTPEPLLAMCGRCSTAGYQEAQAHRPVRFCYSAIWAQESRSRRRSGS